MEESIVDCDEDVWDVCWRGEKGRYKDAKEVGTEDRVDMIVCSTMDIMGRDGESRLQRGSGGVIERSSESKRS